MKTVLVTGSFSGYGLDPARYFHLQDLNDDRHHANAARRRSAAVKGRLRLLTPTT